jgi:trimethylamine monooxygenase
MPDQYYTFTMFDAQARFVRGCLEGRVKFPDKKAMLADTAEWQAREDEAHASGDHAKHHEFQLAHTNNACALVGFQMRDDGDLLIQWQDDRHRLCGNQPVRRVLVEPRLER